MEILNWKLTKDEMETIQKIVKRAWATRPTDIMGMTMDLTACHCNGNPLNLAALLEAPEFDFYHDVFGIQKHIDRETGKLTNCFRPRCSA